MLNPRSLLLASALFAASIATPVPLAAQTISDNFNAGAANFAATFTQRGFTSWTYFETGGVADTGAVRGAGAFTSAAIHNLALPNAPGAIFTLGLDFQVGNQAVSSSGDVAGIGLLSSNNFGWETFQTGHASHLTKVDLANTSGSNQTRLRFFRGNGAGGGTGGISSFTPMLTSGNWYRLSATYTNTGSDFGIDVSLFDLGSSGLSTPTLLRNATTTAGLPELAAASTVYVGLYGGTSGGETMRANRLDNFSATAVPEPGALALLGAGLSLLALRRNRRVARAEIGRPRAVRP